MYIRLFYAYTFDAPDFIEVWTVLEVVFVDVYASTYWVGGVWGMGVGYGGRSK